MTKYELKKCTREVAAKNKQEIKEFCTLDAQDVFPQTIAAFDSAEESLSALKDYETEINYNAGAVPYYAVTEYFVEVVEYDDDGEIMRDGNYLDCTPMPGLPE